MYSNLSVHLNPVKYYPKNPLGYVQSYVKIDSGKIMLRNEQSVQCPVCQKGIIKKRPNKWVAACPSCTAVYNFFQPTPFQDAFLRNLFSPRKRNALVGNIGAFRSGKTTLDMYALTITALQVPGSKSLVLANDLNMLKRVATTELESFLMDEWLETKDGKPRKSFKDGYYFKNGSSIIFLPSDDVQKIRSNTASAIVVVEADKLPYNFIEELEGRLSQYGVGTQGLYDENNQPIYVEEETTFLGKTTKMTRQAIARNYMYMICEANPDANT